MKISKYSTIPFENTGKEIYNVNHLSAIPIVPKGEQLVIVELDQATRQSGFTFKLINEKTGKITELTNISDVVCVFKFVIPTTLRCGVYRLEIEQTRNMQVYTDISQPFRVVKMDKKIVKIKTNNVENKLDDGTPSIYRAREFYMYHYAYRDSLNFNQVENVTQYDDGRGELVNLRNYSNTMAVISLLCAEYTAKALFVIANNSFLNIEFKNHKNESVYYNLVKRVGEINTEIINYFYRISCNFNYLLIPVPKKYIKDKPNMVEGGVNHLPSKIFGQGYYNLDYYNFNDKREYTKDLQAIELLDVRFNDRIIPENFLNTLKNENLELRVRDSENIDEIGNNAFPINVRNIYANFASIKKLGRNVKLAKFAIDDTGLKDYQPYGDVQLRLNKEVKEIDGLKIKSPFYADNVIIKNDRINLPNSLVGKINKIENSRITQDIGGWKNLDKECEFINSEFIGTQEFTQNYKIINCNRKQKYQQFTTFNFNNFNGTIENSFTNVAENITYSTSTNPTFEVDENSFIYASSSGNSLNKILSNENRRLSTPTSSNIFVKINNIIAQKFTAYTDNSVHLLNYNNTTNDIYTVTSLEIPNNYNLEFGNFENFNFGNLNVDFAAISLTIIDNFLNNAIANGAITISSKQLLDILSKNNCFNFPQNVGKIIIDNNLDSEYNFASFNYNDTSFQLITGQDVVILNDTNGNLLGRLQEIYPNYNYSNTL